MNISVVLPAYNEEGNIKNLIERIYTAIGRDIEIIVVDDASTDNTRKTAEAMGAKVLMNPYNMGNGAAIKRGVREAAGDIVVLMDADGQHHPEDIPVLLNGLEHFDMVIGSRIHSHQVWWRCFANYIFNLLASYVTGVKIRDLTSGFRAVKRKKMLEFLYLLPNTFSYPSTSTLAFLKAAYPIKFETVTVSAREKGKSKIHLIQDGMRFLIIIMRIAVFFSPLKIFIPVSFFFSLSGFIYYIYTFVYFHRFTNMSALLFTTSIIIFMLGLISEQIAHLRMDKTGEQ